MEDNSFVLPERDGRPPADGPYKLLLAIRERRLVFDLQTEAEEPAAKPAPKTSIQRKFDLIDKFIQGEHKLDPSRESKPKKNLAKPYTQRPDSMMTETLAKVYLQQKNYKKAIQAYEILILKNPEKSGFFADQIRAIKKLSNKEES